MGGRFSAPVFSSLLVVAALAAGGVFGGRFLVQGALVQQPTAMVSQPVEALPAVPTIIAEPLAINSPPALPNPSLESPLAQAAADPIPPNLTADPPSPPAAVPSATPTPVRPSATAPTTPPAKPSTTPAPNTAATATATPIPMPRARPRIGLQAGHWRTAEHADELASLRTSTGAEGKGWTEREVNLDIAKRTAALLEAAGYIVDLLPSALPVQYKADVFLSLHGDANGDAKAYGFKLARAVRSLIPKIDDALVEAVYRKYGEITGLPRDDKRITNNMRYYYAFAGSNIKHAVAPTTPAAILEMGFMTNPGDRQLLMGSPDLIAKAVAASLAEFLNSRQ